MKLLLDEHFSPEIARQLRARGRDALAARELPEVRGMSDPALLAWARTENRAVVTENVADFAELHRRSVMRGRPHAGLIFTSPRGFPRTRRAIGRLVTALDRLLDAHVDLDGQVRWL